jgi:hypothetical protein
MRVGILTVMSPGAHSGVGFPSSWPESTQSKPLFRINPVPLQRFRQLAAGVLYPVLAKDESGGVYVDP